MPTETLGRALGLFKGLFGSYKRSIAILVVLGFFGGFLESLGVSILVPLFAHLLQQDITGAGTITKIFDWIFHLFGLQMRLSVLLPLMVILFAVRAVVLWSFEYIRTSITGDYERNMRRDLYQRLLSADWSYLLKEKIGNMETAILGELASTTKLLTSTTNSILTFTSLIAYLGVAFTINAPIAILTLVVGLVVLILFRPLLKHSREEGRQSSQMSRSASHDINQAILGLKSIKANGKEKQLGAHMLHIFNKMRDLRLRQATGVALTTAIVQPVSVLFIALVFAYAFSRPGFDLGSFVIVIFLIQRVFTYVDRAQMTLHDVNQQIPYASHIVHRLNELDKHREKEEGEKPYVFKNNIEFADVSFQYQQRSPVLKNVNFSINKGETLGIIGPSGAGKSTIADLLLRLLEPKKGSITLDKIPLQEIELSKWREHVAYVSQDFFLLNDSILNNVRFYDDRINPKEVEEAIVAVGLGDIIKNLPQGLETSVGERGIELSVGQRQRIVLARALVRKPDILILDEATSALDGESERAIHEALQKLHGSMTMVIIAHRLTTVMETDRIVVIEKGKIAEEGAPTQLLQDEKSYFYRLTHL